MSSIERPKVVDDLEMGEKLRFVTFDFETLTPARRSPEPFELGFAILDPGLEVLEKSQVFILPPSDVVFTAMDVNQTGVKPSDVVGADSADIVLAQFDTKLAGLNCVFIAHNAPYDYRIFRRFHKSMPYAHTRPFVDTLKLAKAIVPGLKSYGLSQLAQEFNITIPDDRHRALPDVLLTIEVLLHLLSVANHGSEFKVSEMIRLGGITNWGGPKQYSLF